MDFLPNNLNSILSKIDFKVIVSMQYHQIILFYKVILIIDLNQDVNSKQFNSQINKLHRTNSHYRESHLLKKD